MSADRNPRPMRLMGCINRFEQPTVPSMPVVCDACAAELWLSVPMHARGDITPLCMPCLALSIGANPQYEIGGILPETRNAMLQRGWTPQQLNTMRRTLRRSMRKLRHN